MTAMSDMLAYMLADRARNERLSPLVGLAQARGSGDPALAEAHANYAAMQNGAPPAKKWP